MKKERAYAPLGCFEEVGGWGKYDRWCSEKTLSGSLKELEIVPVLPANQQLSPLALCGGSGVLYQPV